MRWVQVVENDEAVADLARLKLTKVNTLNAEGSLLTFLTNVSSALGQVFIELNLLRLFVLILWVIASASQFQNWLLITRAFNVADLDWQVQSVLLGLERTEQGENVADLV